MFLDDLNTNKQFDKKTYSQWQFFLIQMAKTSIFQISSLNIVSKGEVSGHISDHFLFQRKP